MRVSPWDQYQLVDQNLDSDLQLASGKNRLVAGCASFVCFGCAVAGLESSSPLKVGPTQQQEVLPGPPVSEKGKDQINTGDLVDSGSNTRSIVLKSNLKQPTNSIPVSVEVGNKCEAWCEKGKGSPAYTERRKVQWMDAFGGELVEIREFELSDNGVSDDEYDNVDKSCSCSIM